MGQFDFLVDLTHWISGDMADITMTKGHMGRNGWIRTKMDLPIMINDEKKTYLMTDQKRHK